MLGALVPRDNVGRVYSVVLRPLHNRSPEGQQWTDQ